MIDETTLRQLYLAEQRSIRAIAETTHVPVQTVRELLGRYGIPRRPAGFQPAPDQPDERSFDQAALRRLYLDERRSIRDIAAQYRISTRSVYDALVRYRIPRRSGGYRRPAPRADAQLEPAALDEATLRRLYEQEGETIAAIAAALACPPSRVRDALVRYRIPRRRRGRRYSRI